MIGGSTWQRSVLKVTGLVWLTEYTVVDSQKAIIYYILRKANPGPHIHKHPQKHTTKHLQYVHPQIQTQYDIHHTQQTYETQQQCRTKVAVVKGPQDAYTLDYDKCCSSEPKKIIPVKPVYTWTIQKHTHSSTKGREPGDLHTDMTSALYLRYRHVFSTS